MTKKLENKCATTTDSSDAASGASAPPNGLDGLTPEQRYQRVAEGAYLRAAARGFLGGDPMQDWLEAESDITEQ